MPSLAQFVYFISDGDAIKIGLSKTPKGRLRTLQTGHPRELVLLASLEGSRRLEREIHERFANLRLRGEWFRDDGEIRKWLRSSPNATLTREQSERPNATLTREQSERRADEALTELAELAGWRPET